MLSQLFYHQSNCLPESEIWSQLQHLSNIHEDLAKNFNALLESINSLDILNVYQEHEDSDTYNLVSQSCNLKLLCLFQMISNIFPIGT